MHRVRLSVRENRLTSTIISEDDYIAAIEQTGRGWVIEHDARIAGFAIGIRNGNVWALFIDPACEGRGYGRELHAAMISWLWRQGLERLWLTTEPGTRAERFYKAAGWVYAGRTEGREIRLELAKPMDNRAVDGTRNG